MWRRKIHISEGFAVLFRLSFEPCKTWVFRSALYRWKKSLKSSYPLLSLSSEFTGYLPVVVKGTIRFGVISLGVWFLCLPFKSESMQITWTLSFSSFCKATWRMKLNAASNCDPFPRTSVFPEQEVKMSLSSVTTVAKSTLYLKPKARVEIKQDWVDPTLIDGRTGKFMLSLGPNKCLVLWRGSAVV